MPGSIGSLVGQQGVLRARGVGRTPPCGRSDLVPYASVVRTAALIVAGSKDSETSDGMVDLGSNRNTKSEEERVDDT